MKLYETIRPLDSGHSLYHQRNQSNQKNVKYPGYINFKLYMEITELLDQGKTLEQAQKILKATDIQIQAYKNTKAQQIKVLPY